MEIWQGLLLGFIQGATEFFPVSSSGHLYLAEIWLGLKPDINFSILLHAASLLAVMVVFRNDVLSLLKAGLNVKALYKDGLKGDGRLAWQLIAATLCTVVVALVIEPYFESLLDLTWVAATLIITGVLIVIAERFRSASHPRVGEDLLKASAGDSCLRRNEAGETEFTWTLAMVLGLVQGLAVVPGISRSGLTIAFLILVGLNRQLAVRVSFLLSIPTILGALVFMVKDQWGSFNFGVPALIGFSVSFIVALISILLMRNLVEKRWIWFAPYCVLLGMGILVFTIFS